MDNLHLLEQSLITSVCKWLHPKSCKCCFGYILTKELNKNRPNVHKHTDKVMGRILISK